MSRKRMFDNELIDQDKFLDLPLETVALYFLLGMKADDEGFVTPKKVLRMYGGSIDSIKILASKGYIIPFESGVVVITDFKRNNWLDSRRIVPTIYQEEKAQLEYNDQTKLYSLKSLNPCESNAKQMLSYSLSNGLERIEQNRIEEKSIEEYSTVEKKENKKKPKVEKTKFAEFVSMTNEEYNKLLSEYGEEFTKKCIELLDNYKGSSGKKYASDYRAILTWVINRVKEDNAKKNKANYGNNTNWFAELGKEENIF